MPECAWHQRPQAECSGNEKLPDPPIYWEREATDDILENDSLFMLSGESNGSYKSSKGHFVYPPRCGLDRIKVDALNVNRGCNVSAL
jgi:hypothetical protein